MAVLTEKEYKALPTWGRVTYIDEPKKHADVSIVKINKNRKEKIIKKMYHLFHPENGIEGDLKDFEDTLILEGIEYKRICKMGVVQTGEKKLVKFLLSKGYEFIGEVIDGNK